MNYRDISWKFSSPNVSYLEFPINKSTELKLRIEKQRSKDTYSIYDMIIVKICKKDEFIVLGESCVVLSPRMQFPFYSCQNPSRYIATGILEPLMNDIDSALWTAIGVFRGRIPYEEES